MSISNDMNPTSLSSLQASRLGPPVWLGTAIGLAWFVAAELIIASANRRSLALAGFGLAAVVMVVTIIQQYLHDRRRGRVPIGALGALLICTSAVGVVIFAGGLTSVTSVVWRQLPAHLMAVVSSSLLTGWWHHQQRQVADPLRGRFAAFIMTIVVWSFGFTALSWAVFLGLPLWRLLVVTVITSSLASVVVWLDAGLEPSRVWRTLGPTVVLTAEIWIVSWWLPTAVLVGTTVATTMCLLYTQVARHLWLHTWHPGRGRRYALVGLAVIGLTLLSARWV